jgi:transposase
MDDTGAVVLRKRIARRDWLAFIANVPPLRIGMEACGSAHDWARCVREPGPDGRLIAPPCIQAYVKSPKNDARDAEAMCEVVTRPTRRFVPIKRVAQQDLHARHRVRERRITARTALVNESRGLLSASGMILPHSLTKFRALIVDQRHKEQAQLTPLSAEVVWHLYDELRALEKRVAYDEEKRAAIGQAHPACQRLQTIPGIGPVTATALIAAIGDVTPCTNGRQVAAWLGLVPRAHSTGGKPRLLGMSKRGNIYLRKLLVHGARATLRWIETKDDARSRWLRALIARRGKNRAAVALANKNARIVWALLAHDQEYHAQVTT